MSPKLMRAGSIVLMLAAAAQHAVERRSDYAKSDMFFKGSVQGGGSVAAPYVPNARHQTTLTLVTTTWF